MSGPIHSATSYQSTGAPTPPVPPMPPVEAGPPFGAGMVVVAVLLTIFMPLIALIVALIMRSSETNPLRRAFLKTWALVTGALVVVWLIISIALVSAVVATPPAS